MYPFGTFARVFTIELEVLQAKRNQTLAEARTKFDLATNRRRAEELKARCLLRGSAEFETLRGTEAHTLALECKLAEQRGYQKGCDAKQLELSQAPSIVRVVDGTERRLIIQPSAPVAKCPACAGNDGDAPCAYPCEGKNGCLRDKRLGVSSPTTKRKEEVNK